MDTNKTDDWLNPFSKMTRSQMVVEAIKKAIIHEHLKPGDFIPSENELVSRLNVGKSSIREAVKILEAMGVVECRQGQGNIIKNTMDYSVLNPLTFQLLLQPRENEDLLELRMMFEPAATMIAMKHATDEDYKQIEDLVNELESLINTKGVADVENDVAFHRAIYQATHNSYISLIGNTVTELFYKSLQVSNEKAPMNVLMTHKNILNNMKKGDKLGLEKTILESLKEWDHYTLHNE